jgi:hypothetical protein
VPTAPRREPFQSDDQKHTPYARIERHPIRRQPEPPPGLDEFEQHVMASDAPAVVLADRAFLRALLRYVRRLESDLAVPI